MKKTFDTPRQHGGQYNLVPRKGRAMTTTHEFSRSDFSHGDSSHGNSSRGGLSQRNATQGCARQGSRLLPQRLVLILLLGLAASMAFPATASATYDPGQGRFHQLDPIGFAGGDLNLYAYVDNAPLIWVDPTGEWKYRRGSIWCADKEGDTLQSLAAELGDETNWVCIWPTKDSSQHWNNYPQASLGAKADASNLISKGEGKLNHLIMSPIPGEKDNYTVGVRIIMLASQGWDDGLGAARLIKSTSREGGAPISQLIIGAHGGAGVHLGNRNGGRLFAASDLFSVATEKDNKNNSHQSAEKAIGPPKCWFARTANVYGLGCHTNTWANDWASTILRKGATAHGTRHFVQAAWRIKNGKQMAAVRFSRDSKGDDPLNEIAWTLRDALKLPEGWTKAEGTQ